MKIYTEVNYELKNEILEQVSSESFDYSGPILQCGGPPPKPPKIVTAITEAASDVGEGVTGAVETVTEAAADVGSGVTTTLADAGSGINTTLSDATSGINTTLSDASGAITTGINKGTQNLTFALDKTVGAVGLAAAKGIGKLLGTYSDPEGGGDGDTSAAPKRDAPGASESIGAGGQGGMKSASMGAVKKTTAGAGGKRRLRKVSRSGAKV